MRINGCHNILILQEINIFGWSFLLNWSLKEMFFIIVNCMPLFLSTKYLKTISWDIHFFTTCYSFPPFQIVRTYVIFFIPIYYGENGLEISSIRRTYNLRYIDLSISTQINYNNTITRVEKQNIIEIFE